MLTESVGGEKAWWMRKKNGKKTLRMKNGKRKNGNTLASAFFAEILSLVTFWAVFSTFWNIRSPY